MSFKELKEKFESEIVNDEEFELIQNSCEVEFDRIESEYYQVFKYSAINEENDDYFDFYYEKILT